MKDKYVGGKKMARNGGKMAKRKICVLFKFPDFTSAGESQKKRFKQDNDLSFFGVAKLETKLMYYVWTFFCLKCVKIKNCPFNLND